MSPVTDPILGSEAESAPISATSSSAVSASILYVKRHYLIMLVCSAAVLIPCFWQHHIQATDLGSHLYNAWLAQLIRAGKAPGLYFVPQYSNVLFDWILDVLFRFFGPTAAERIAVSIAVLFFFWGGFSLCAAAAGRPPWRVIPLLAMVTYGFIFNIGFMNLYLSVGLSLFAVALIWRGQKRDFVLLVPLLMLAFLAHSLGTVGILGIGGYVLLARVLPNRWRLFLVPISLAIYLLLRTWVVLSFPIFPRAVDFYWMAGADQLVIYGPSYLWLAGAVLLIALLIVLLDAWGGRDRQISLQSPFLQLYLMMVIIVVSVPGGFLHPRLGSMGFLPDRLSIYTAILLCCVISMACPRAWQIMALGAIAILFFTRMYIDTSHLDHLGQLSENTVSSLEPGTRVVATVFPLAGRINEQHIIDRACIGHCFYLPNYEPASRQFRIRAAPNSRLAATTNQESFLMQRGLYLVKPEDLPLKEIYSCGPTLDSICMYDLRAGEFSGGKALEEIGVDPRSVLQ